MRIVSVSCKSLWLVSLVLLLVGLMGCSDTETDLDSDGDREDGDAVDGDVSDGDQPNDGDTDTSDGDEEADTEAELPPVPVNYVVLAQDDLAESGQAFAAYREELGFSTAFFTVSDLVPLGSSVENLIAEVTNRLRPLKEELDDEPLFLLLIGDDPEGDESRTGRIPTQNCTNSLGGCYTDNAYGDLDADGIPEVAVGRIPARTAQQVQDYLTKLEDHEHSYEVGLWNRQITLYAGEAGFGDTIDSAMEMLLFKAIDSLDQAFSVRGAYQVKSSPYYYYPFEDIVVDLYSGGSIMNIYIGHGSRSGSSAFGIDELNLVDCQHRRPHAFLFCCSSGDFRGDHPENLAEALTLFPDGPITTFASSDVSHPYANAVLPYELQRAALNLQPATVGEALLIARRQAFENTEDSLRELMVSVSVMSDVPEEDLEPILYEHLNLYNLLGDPAAAMKYPYSRIVFDDEAIVGTVDSGHLEVSGETPGIVTGEALVTLEVPQDKYVHEVTAIDPNGSLAAQLETIQANWEIANDKTIIGVTVPVENGRFTVELTFDPELAEYKNYIKVYADDGVVDSFGVMRAPE